MKRWWKCIPNISEERQETRDKRQVQTGPPRGDNVRSSEPHSFSLRPSISSLGFAPPPTAASSAHPPSRLSSLVSRLSFFLCVLLITAACLARAQQSPPLIPPPEAPQLAVPLTRTLPNGLTVWVLESHNLPVVTLDLAIKAGSEADPQDLPGLAQFEASLLDEGTTRRTAQQIASAIDDAGGSIDTGAEWDDSYASITILSSHCRLAFDLLSSIATRPAFRSSDVERIRKQTLSALDVLREDPEYIADTVIDEEAFRGTPYSHPANGVAESIRRITPEILKRFHARYYRPSNAGLVVVGDIAPERAYDLAQKYFGKWQGREAPALPRPEIAPPATGRRVVVIDDPNAIETVIRIANRAVPRNDAAYPALSIASQILGGPAENLLFNTLRTARGLVYGASSELDCYHASGIWEEKTSTRSAETIKVVGLMLDEMKKLRGRTVGPWELENAQNYFVGHMALEFESTQDVADHLVELLVYDLPPAYWNSFPQKVRGLTLRELRDSIRTYLNPKDAVIVLVGNVSKFKQSFNKLGSVRVVSLSDLEL